MARTERTRVRFPPSRHDKRHRQARRGTPDTTQRGAKPRADHTRTSARNLRGRKRTMKIKRTEHEGEVSIWFYCPGCEDMHRIVAGNGRWEWNGSEDKPTFSPSVLVTYGHYATGKSPEECDICKARGEYGACGRCHSFVRDGQIQFLGDCTHALANQTVELPEHNFSHIT